MAHNSGSLPKCSGIFDRLPTEDGEDVKGDEVKVPDFLQAGQ
jgi:hypothetical protein